VDCFLANRSKTGCIDRFVVYYEKTDKWTTRMKFYEQMDPVL